MLQEKQEMKITNKEHKWLDSFTDLLYERPEDTKLFIVLDETNGVVVFSKYDNPLSAQQNNWVDTLNKAIEAMPNKLWFSVDEDGWFVGKGKPKIGFISGINHICIFENSGLDVSDRKRFYIFECLTHDIMVVEEVQDDEIDYASDTHRLKNAKWIQTKSHPVLYEHKPSLDRVFCY